MEAAVLCITAFIAAGLTFLSGFGLGTLLLPVFAVFFSIDKAIAMTAMVHLFNNLLKLYLVGRYVDRQVTLRFGVPAVLAAFLGAWALAHLSDLPSWAQYHLFGHAFEIVPVKVVVGCLLIVFTLLEMGRNARGFLFGKEYMPLGGLLSGFFGGLSGHQGALRSAFLINAGLSKEQFIGTGVVIACLVDFARLVVYGVAFPAISANDQLFLFTAMAAAFAGSLAGNYLVEKMTIHTIQIIVSVMVLGIAVGLVLGMV
jgi:uncharacterized membrane protein YfcA